MSSCLSDAWPRTCVPVVSAISRWTTMNREADSVGFMIPVLPNSCQKWDSSTLKAHKRAEGRKA